MFIIYLDLVIILPCHGKSHLFPIEEKIHLVNSDKTIAPVASTGGVADGVVAGGEAGEHSFGERELFWQKCDEVNVTKPIDLVAKVKILV